MTQCSTVSSPPPSSSSHLLCNDFPHISDLNLLAAGLLFSDGCRLSAEDPQGQVHEKAGADTVLKALIGHKAWLHVLVPLEEDSMKVYGVKRENCTGTQGENVCASV